MPEDKQGLARLIASMGLRDPRIAEAFEAVDRAGFVPVGLLGDAYLDRPIPIPESQTTSQPSLIALMIDAAAPGPSDRVLEVGTGYGFQTALLARLAGEVVSVERHASLAATARGNLERNGATNVSVYVGDGWKGYQQRAPYDAIVVSAAASEVPEALIRQLAEGGRLVIPVSGPRGDDVHLYVKTKGVVEDRRTVSPARFVPLVKGDGS